MRKPNPQPATELTMNAAPQPTIETRPIPPLAMTAYRLTEREFLRAVDQLGVHTVAVLGLSESDNWVVDFESGTMTRAVTT